MKVFVYFNVDQALNCIIYSWLNIFNSMFELNPRSQGGNLSRGLTNFLELFSLFISSKASLIQTIAGWLNEESSNDKSLFEDASSILMHHSSVHSLWHTSYYYLKIVFIEEMKFNQKRRYFTILFKEV